jgi:hypothetical protein
MTPTGAAPSTFARAEEDSPRVRILRRPGPPDDVTPVGEAAGRPLGEPAPHG